MKKVYVYDPTASDFQSAVRGVGRYLQILKENFSKEFKFISNIENCLPAGKAGKLKIENLIIVHDDLDIPLGKFHIQQGVGPQLHNGLESIEQHLKTKDFLRIRIGVDARVSNKWTCPERSRRVDGESYVLKNFLAEEKTRLEKEIFPKLFTQLQTLCYISKNISP